MELIKKILIPLTDPEQSFPYLKLAAALLPPDGNILALRVVRIPDESSLSEGAEEALSSRADLELIQAQIPDQRVELKTLVRVARRLSEGIAETAREERCDSLLLPWKGYTASEDRFFGGTIDRLLAHPPCNCIVARAGDFSQCKRILLPVRGGPYAEFALNVATRLAGSLSGEVMVLHSKQRFAPPEVGDEPYQAFLEKLKFHPHVTRLLAARGDPKKVIIDESKRHDIVIVGAGASAEPQTFFLGPIVEHLTRETNKPLLVVKTPQPIESWMGTDRLVKPRPLSERVDKWFAENTFHRSEFEDRRKLLQLKEKQGVRVSLGLPALNEAETIGNILRTVKKEFLKEKPLLDEIVLIDSGSTDDTVKIARDLGIPVYDHRDILSRHGSYRGKGEALWKSLYLLSGDIILWVDTDIKNFYPGFVYGVLGPLLREPEIQFVKGFYRRPLKVGGKLVAEGGGRVTELTVRPLLNLFFPELSGMIQPLAGEYGGRRKALERVPFFTGYGVETGLLIDIFNEFGLRSIAQVDLEERIHRNQTLPALSQMSFAILQVFIQRLEEKNRVRLLEDVNRSMKLITRRRESYALELKEIGDHERPPMITIPEYRASRLVTRAVEESLL